MTTATLTDTTALRALLLDLRTAGWRHTREWVDLYGRDADGAPWSDDDAEHHQWIRGEERIEAYFDRANGTGFMGWVNYDPEFRQMHDSNMVAVGAIWIENQGAAGLRRLAVVLGILPR